MLHPVELLHQTYAASVTRELTQLHKVLWYATNVHQEHTPLLWGESLPVPNAYPATTQTLAPCRSAQYAQ
jgi:hypothetical protein